MTSITIYHNPRCSKSREALAILEDEFGIDNIEIIEYLKTELTVADVKRIISLLGCRAIDIVRKKEKEYLLIEDVADENNVISCIVQHRRLLERPLIVFDNKHAIIARPSSVLTEFLQLNKYE